MIHMAGKNSSQLPYSTIRDIKRDFCQICALFKQNIYRGIQSGFIIKPFTCKDFHVCCQTHLSSQWHRQSTTRAGDIFKCYEK